MKRSSIGAVFMVLLVVLSLLPGLVQALDTSQGDGLLFYAAAANTTPQWRTYSSSSNNFSANSGTVVGAQPAITAVKTSPTKQEAIAAYQDTSGNLRVLCYDGTSWSQDWTVAVAGAGTPTTRRFDIAYETTTGDVTVAYSRNTAASNALAYRTKAGSTGCGAANWAAAANFPTATVVTSGTVMWVKSARNGVSGSDLSAWVWLDNAATNADLGGAIWSGSIFTNFKVFETSMEHITTVGDTDNFDVQYESLSGDVMVVWGMASGANGTNGSRYMTCTGGTSACTWGAATAIPTIADDATSLDLSADPLTDKMAFAAIGNAGSDLSAAYWSGTAWTGKANVDTSTETPTVGMKLVTTGWLTNNGNTKWYLSYDDSLGAGLSYKYAIDGGAITSPTDFTSTPALNDIRGRYDTDMNPFNNAELIQTVSDSTNGIFAYKLSMDTAGNLSWSNMASAVSLGTKPSHPQQGFAFTYWRHIPAPTYTQSAYRLFANADSPDVGAPLANQDIAATLSNVGDPFRLRVLLHMDTNQVAVNGQNFKLQFVGKGSGSCAAPSGGTPLTYTDVSAATVIAWNDNPSALAVDGDSLVANANDPTHSGHTRVDESYEEANNNPVLTLIPSGQDGKWDFSLKDNSAPQNTTYCLRMVKSDGSALNTYSSYPEITTATAAAQSLSFSISDNAIGFGSLSSAAARYATGDALGSASEVEAHTLIAASNASSGYTITVQGATLTSGGNTITAIGGTNTASAIGTEQFGLRMTATGGSGSVSSPYSAAGFAYAANASTASTVGSASGSSTDTTYSVRYLSNISATTEAGSYGTSLVFVATANF